MLRLGCWPTSLSPVRSGASTLTSVVSAVLLTSGTSAADYLESRMDYALREIQDEYLDRGEAGRVATLIEFAIGEA